MRKRKSAALLFVFALLLLVLSSCSKVTELRDLRADYADDTKDVIEFKGNRYQRVVLSETDSKYALQDIRLYLAEYRVGYVAPKSVPLLLSEKNGDLFRYDPEGKYLLAHNDEVLRIKYHVYCREDLVEELTKLRDNLTFETYCFHTSRYDQLNDIVDEHERVVFLSDEVTEAVNAVLADPSNKMSEEEADSFALIGQEVCIYPIDQSGLLFGNRFLFRFDILDNEYCFEFYHDGEVDSYKVPEAYWPVIRDFAITAEENLDEVFQLKYPEIER